MTHSLERNYCKGFDSIILFNWWKIQEGEYKYTRLDLNDGNDELDDEAYCIINDEYLEEFGLGDDFERVLELRTQIALLQCDFVINDDNYLRNKIRTLQNELKEIMERPIDFDRDAVLIQLEKWMGFKLDEKEIKARKFYKIVNEYKREAEAKKAS